MAKKMARLEKEKQQPETVAKKTRSRHEALSSCMDELPPEPSPFNNLKCLKQKDCIPRMPTQVGNYLHESSPSATFLMDLPQVPQERSRPDVDKGVLDEEKQRESLAEVKRRLEEKIEMQDETIAQQKALLEAMKEQHEKRMLEAKIEMQDKVIAQTKAMVEAKKLQHENGMLEAKIQIQDEVIAEQKAMLEVMKLQDKKKMLMAKIQMQDDIIAQQKDMLGNEVAPLED